MLPVSSIDSGGVLHQLHTYDENGNVVATHDLNDTTRSRTMEYDGLDRLVEAQSAIFGGSGVHRFEYDAVDNLMHWTLGGVKDYARYVYGADNRLARIEGTGGGTLHTFSHDVQGNVTDKDSTDYHFDIGNRLRLVATPTVTESYRYDGHGRRVLAWTSAGSKLSMYSATGQIIYQQLFPATQNKAIDYITLSGSLVANREVPLGGGTAVVKYQHTDALGSPVAVTDGTGAVIERTDYDPYGGVIGGPKDGVGYTGHVMDAGTGLHYMQQRYFDPALGRFLSVDPVSTNPVSTEGFNRYSYVTNNPYGFIDPDGRKERKKTDVCEIASQACLQQIPSRHVETLTSSADETRSQFVKRAAKRLRRLTDDSGKEQCGKICKSDEGWVLKIYTSDSHIVCRRGPSCESGDTIHTHGKKRYKVNSVDYLYLRYLQGSRSEIGDRVSQNVDEFSDADIQDGSGFLVTKDRILYQNGEKTQRIWNEEE